MDGNLVGRGDLRAQAHQAFANVGRALGRGQTTRWRGSHLRRGHRPEHLPLLRGQDRAVRRPQAGGHVPRRRALAEPGYLIEVEAIAVLD